MKIKILNRDIDVQFVQNIESESSPYGIAILDKNIIQIQKGLNKDIEKEVLLHEVFHFIQDAFGLKQDEKVTDAYARGVLTVIKDNPKSDLFK